MPPKNDPYSNKTHRRIDVALLVITILILFFVLRASAHAQMVTIGSGEPRESTDQILSASNSTGGGGGGGGRQKGGDPAWIGPGGSTGTPTTGTWNTAGNWSPSGVPSSTSSTTQLDFGGSLSTSYTSTDDIAGNFTFGTINLKSTSSATDTIAASAGQLLLVATSGATISQNTGASGAFTISMGIMSAVTGNSGTATLTLGGDGSGLVTLSGVLSQQNNNKILALTKTGNSTFILSGANTYTGATQVNGGTLYVNGSLASGSAVTVSNSGTVLGGSGTINGTISVGSGAILQGGSGSTGQTLTLKGAVTMNTGSIIQLALGSSLAHSTIAMSSATLTFATNQDFKFIYPTVATTGTYTGIITGVSNPTQAVMNTWKIDTFGTTGSFSWDAANSGEIDLTLTAVPEPGTWFAAALAFPALAYAQRRRFARLLVSA